ncbi:hypothetical protein GH714_020974 [Hevea brasiliensis]|uniref:Uncharacterized protein n=1 Tax=Hevea brasiliensis TaxID=3981 RepID=A0A6A6NI47_HEVBR|nr:hypothetical protein GH714_020974 [Hevea brasiliensis]
MKKIGSDNFYIVVRSRRIGDNEALAPHDFGGVWYGAYHYEGEGYRIFIPASRCFKGGDGSNLATNFLMGKINERLSFVMPPWFHWHLHGS